MVNTRAEAENAVAACLYPPRGNRSVGGSVHALNFGASANDYYDHIDDEVLIVLQCEHIQAVETPLSALWTDVEAGRVEDLKTLALILALKVRRPELFAPPPAR